MDTDKDPEVEKFKDSISRLGGYEEYLLVVKAPSGRLHWKASDKTWALGAIHRFKTCTEAWDHLEEKETFEENK